MATWEKRGEGWSVRWRGLNGANHRRSAPTLRAARALAADVEETLARGREWVPHSGEAAPPLVTAYDESDAIGAYCREMAARWRPSTLAQRKVSLSVFAAWLASRDPRKRLPLSALNRDVLPAYLDHLLTTRHIVGYVAAQKVQHVRQFWTWAYGREDWEGHVPKPHEFRITADPPEKMEAPTWAEMDAAIESARTSVEAPRSGAIGRWDRLMLVLRCTGLRPGQAMRLRWSDLDLDRAVLRVRAELGKTKAERKGRTVPLAPVLVSEASGWGVREGLLIPWTGNRTPQHGTARQFWARTDARPAAYESPLHGFRHGFISELARAGVPRELREKLVGHNQGTHGDYTADEAVFSELREAVAVVPPLASGRVLRFRVAE